MATWNLENTKAHILICNGSSCMRKEGEDVTLAIREQLTKKGLDEQIHTARTRCLGRCKDACTVIVYPEGTWYYQMTAEDAEPFVDAISQAGKLQEKVSHTFIGEGFERHNNVPVGISKSKAK